MYHFLYIDPGSGSYLLQLIIAAVVGVAVYFKTIWWKIKGFFTGTRKDNATTDSLTKDDVDE